MSLTRNWSIEFIVDVLVSLDVKNTQKTQSCIRPMTFCELIFQQIYNIYWTADCSVIIQFHLRHVSARIRPDR